MSEIPQEKLTVFIHTDFTLAMTGFGKAARAIFEYLYLTNKYNLINFAVGSVDVQLGETCARTPWKTIASVNAQNLENIKRQNDPRQWENIERMAGYGAFELDQAVKREKPDVFIAIQDIWGIDFAVDKSWFKKIPCALWTTLDSLPILPKAIELAPNVKNYWSWADFATQALHREGHKHVKTVRGPIDCRPFFRLPEYQRNELRKRFGIPDKTFVIGYVFRNQLRKSVPNLLQGFKTFKTNNPKEITKLLFHTSWVEGWDIPKLMQEYGIQSDDVLTTYLCKNCRKYGVKPFTGNDLNCPYCGAEKQYTTTHPSAGISEQDLNEVYNLMDVYCHPFTSGGQEIPIQEAKLTELITLVTNYSCGEDSCTEEASSLPLDWAEYREPGTQFIKASTYPSDISKKLQRVFEMDESSKRKMGKKARQWVLDNFSIEVIGKFLEQWIDAASKAKDSCFDDSDKAKDPYHQVPEIADNDEWILYLYKHILKMDMDKDNSGFKHWKDQLSKGAPRVEIEKYFRQVAFGENQKNQINQVQFDSLLNPKDKGRVILVQPESSGDVFLLSAIFKSIKERYPDWAFYVATKPEYRDLVAGNPYVDHWLEYNSMMDNILWLEGNSTHNGYFNVAYLPYILTQRVLGYLHNGQDRIDYTTQEGKK
jgi:glycosyltransferase involved in cell wall biosynthesis